MPMAVYAFLEGHAGNGLSSIENSIPSLFPNSTILEGLAISRITAQNNYEEAKQAVIEWLQENSII